MLQFHFALSMGPDSPKAPIGQEVILTSWNIFFFLVKSKLKEISQLKMNKNISLKESR